MSGVKFVFLLTDLEVLGPNLRVMGSDLLRRLL